MNRIPIRNLYYLLCYAWDVLQESDLLDLEDEDIDAGRDLLARILEAGTSYLLRRGLDRSYVLVEEDTRSPKGKPNISVTAKRSLLVQGRVNCQYDEFSQDVLQNRLLKTTIGKVIRCREIDEDIRKRLVRVYRRLGGIKEVEVSSKLFDSIVYHRNNRFYRFALNVCRLIHEESLVGEDKGASRFRDFVRDEHAMRRLFEKFVFNFFRREQSEFTVSSERMRWEGVSGASEDVALLPHMRTDISLESPTRKIVIDTKFYSQTLQEYRGKTSVRSANLYQIYSYLQNLGYRSGQNQTLEGVLLYPTVSESLSLDYEIQGHRLRIVTLGLEDDWREIRGQLLQLIT